MNGAVAMDVVIMDVDDPNLTLSQILGMVDRFQSEHPDMDIYLDGDRKAIIGRTHTGNEVLER